MALLYGWSVHGINDSASNWVRPIQHGHRQQALLMPGPGLVRAVMSLCFLYALFSLVLYFLSSLTPPVACIEMLCWSLLGPESSLFVAEMKITPQWKETGSVFVPSQRLATPPPSDCQQRKSLNSYCGLCHSDCR